MVAIAGLAIAAAAMALVADFRFTTDLGRIESRSAAYMRALAFARKAADCAAASVALLSAPDERALQAAAARLEELDGDAHGLLSETAGSADAAVTVRIASRLAAVVDGARTLSTTIGALQQRGSRLADLARRAEIAHDSLRSRVSREIEDSRHDLDNGFQATKEWSEPVAAALATKAKRAASLDELRASGDMLAVVIARAAKAPTEDSLRQLHALVADFTARATKAARQLGDDKSALETQLALRALITFTEKDYDVLAARRRALAAEESRRSAIAAYEELAKDLGKEARELTAAAQTGAHAAASRFTSTLSGARLAATLLVAALLATVAFAWLDIERAVLTRLLDLYRGFGTLARGDLSATIPDRVAGRTEEIESLGEAFHAIKEQGRRKAALEKDLLAARDQIDASLRAREDESARSAQDQDAVLAALREACARLGRGDFSVRLPEARLGPLRPFKDDFDRAVAALARMAADMRAQTGELRAFTRDTHAGSEALTAQIEALASGLPMASGAIEQAAGGHAALVAAIKRADDMLQSAATEARSGSVAAGTAADSIARVQDGSQKIEQIAAQINDIARQTNLLGLNARIEAARAGASHSGFVVVATEVRGLAQRAAEAARDITAVAGESKQQSDEAARLVKTVDGALNAIVRRSEDLGRFLAQTAENAQGPGKAIADAGAAVGGLTRAGEKSAAMCAEAMRHAQTLERLADRLTKSIDGPAPPDAAATRGAPAIPRATASRRTA